MPAVGINAHLCALKGGFANTFEVIDPAIMVIEQAAGIGCVSMLDVVRINGDLQFVIGIEIPTGFVIYQDDLIIPAQDQVNDAHDGGQLFGKGEDERMLHRDHFNFAPVVLLM